MLSSIEVKFIKQLEVGKKYLLKDAADIANLSLDAAKKAAMLLQQKGYLKIYETKEISYKLTEDGEKFLEEGFPEEKLLNLLEKTKDVEELKRTMGEDFSIAVSWLKKKGSVEIKDGKIFLLSRPKIPEKDVLKTVKEKGKVDEKFVEILKKRKLIEEVENKFFEVEILKKPSIIEDYIVEVTPELILSGAWRDKKFLAYDVRVQSKDVYGGKIHPYERIIRECRKIFLEMGFKEIKGHYVQTAFWNFDSLFQPQDHPARDMQDTFYLDKYVDLDEKLAEKVKIAHEKGVAGSTGWGGIWSLEKAKQLVMRTHTTTITIHYLARNPNPPQKAFCIDRVYRREAIDATHLPEFDQLEGVVLDEKVGFKHLLGLLKEFFAKMGFEEVRFRPGYFPYTEPSVEPEVYVDEIGWIELGGAGIFRKEVTEPLGIKGKVLAWGLGIGRLAMLKLGLKDLRKLYLPDLGWLRNARVRT
ncbi:MAG: phenylalanine--tRNA ligase subunit alpha [Archaeoglobaceae archaeon]|nr:phenylalanine--tRNA ligase subunit alpha [Archaeoglobaceae archaeon]MCX8152119.1 phenylalanine--tRNA ligase subunit alpha [Archaeoglobaceae archaeon]MDW8013555.1 phenylalanine--tRNA ligase subunit alpha [Archaeoglobaceae archaeon]